MSSPQKAKGTRFETAVARYLAGRLGDDGVRRSAPAGSRDVGDVHGVSAHGWQGIVECKNHEVVTASKVAGWRRETEAERRNAGADFALLVIHRHGCSDRDPAAASFGLNECQVSLEGLLRIAGAGDGAAEGWVSMSLAEACDLMLPRAADAVTGLHENSL